MFNTLKQKFILSTKLDFEPPKFDYIAIKVYFFILLLSILATK